ncbi:MAG TPA: GvpL/GvpF family gas vesicle protein [Candidatus Dormibacteraeota bacterium]|nr:GvpL/GvpF family gas vesicle protein [Candidatus Dormibacteraeota bacterium]
MKPQYAEQRSLRDVRRGVCLFGVADGALAGRRFSVDGARIEAIAYRDLALLIRRLRPEEMPRVAEADWIARETRAQLRLCERLAAKTSLLPAKAGAAYSSAGDLVVAADQAYRRWRRALGRVTGKHEWLALGYAGPHPVPASHAPLLGKPLTGRRAVIAPPFYEFWEGAAALAAQARLLAPSDARAAFAAAFLVPAERAADFRELLGRTVAAAACGITLYHAGPRAPFHFT